MAIMKFIPEYERRLDMNTFFNNELAMVVNDNVRNFTELCLAAAPDYIFTDCPSSSSGKYHPADELDGNGCVIHTRRVVHMMNLIADGMDDFNHRDEAIAACLIHDLRKQGIEKSGRTVSDHGDLAAALVMEVAVANPGIISDEQFEMIYNAVGCHYGPWAGGNWKMNNFHADADVFCRLVHTADYLASRKEIGPKITF